MDLSNSSNVPDEQTEDDTFASVAEAGFYGQPPTGEQIAAIWSEAQKPTSTFKCEPVINIKGWRPTGAGGWKSTVNPNLSRLPYRDVGTRCDPEYAIAPTYAGLDSWTSTDRAKVRSARKEMDSDIPGIAAAALLPRPLPTIEAPKETAKPALAGFDVTARGDGRLGRWA